MNNYRLLKTCFFLHCSFDETAKRSIHFLELLMCCCVFIITTKGDLSSLSFKVATRYKKHLYNRNSRVQVC